MNFRLLSRRAAASIFAAGLLFAGPSIQAKPAKPASGGAEVELMTFNIRNEGQDANQNSWDYRGKDVLSLINREAPDVVGLQESSGAGQLEDLDKLVVGMRLVPLPGHRQLRRNSILYRTSRLRISDSGGFWLSDTPDRFSTTWGNTYPRSVSWARFVDRRSGRAFYLYNVHLDHESENARERSILLLLDRITARSYPDPFFITGDFNSGESSTVVRYLKGEGAITIQGASQPMRIAVPLVDTYRLANPTDCCAYTVKPFDQPIMTEKFDYIWAQPGKVDVLKAKIFPDNRNGYYPSDHFPVTALLRIK